jgi:hypothetical protein
MGRWSAGLSVLTAGVAGRDRPRLLGVPGREPDGALGRESDAQCLPPSPDGGLGGPEPLAHAHHALPADCPHERPIQDGGVPAALAPRLADWPGDRAVGVPSDEHVAVAGLARQDSADGDARGVVGAEELVAVAVGHGRVAWGLSSLTLVVTISGGPNIEVTARTGSVSQCHQSLVAGPVRCTAMFGSDDPHSSS